MRKKVMILSCIVVIGIATTIAKNVYVSHASETNNLFTQNVEALSEGDEPTLYTRTTGDCVISASAGATVTLKFLGITIASGKAGVDGQIVFKNIQVICEAGGRTLCSPKECADFYVEIAKATKEDDDKKDDKKKSN